jgi:hypothetical protein
MRLALLALALVGCAPHAVPVVNYEAGSGAPGPEMVFLDRAATGAVPNVGLSAMGIAGDRAPTILQLETLLYGSPVYLGVVDCTNVSKTNHQATTPFNNTGNALCGKPLLIQPSAELFLLPVATNTGAVTTATGVDLTAKERVVILMTSKTGSDNTCWLACILSSGTGNLSVWELH